MNFISEAFAIYAVVFIITMSHILSPLRRFFREMCYAVNADFMIKTSQDNPVIEDFGEGEGYDFISCRMCVGAWVSIAFCLCGFPLWDTLAAYGLSYCLATQERD